MSTSCWSGKRLKISIYYERSLILFVVVFEFDARLLAASLCCGTDLGGGSGGVRTELVALAGVGRVIGCDWGEGS